MRRLVLIATLVLLVSPSGAHAAIININTANAAQLDTLPGIGPSKAAAIIDYRTTHGPFARIEDIQNVKGIGPSTFEGLTPLISVTSESTVQPQSPPQSSYRKQPVEPALTDKIIEPVHAEEGVRAPRATSELAALGAALPQQGDSPSSTGSLFRSVWTLGFLGLLVLAGGALMIL